jgi:hypothetical protein
MRVTMRMMTFVVVGAISATLLVPCLSADGCKRVVTDGHALWIEDGVKRHMVLSDPNGIVDPAWSPDQKQIAYARELQTDTPRTELVIVSNEGATVRVLPIPEDTTVNGVLQVGWRDERRAFVEGHVNPATTLYLEWSVAKGKLVDEKPGSWFAVSPDGRSLAQRAHVPLGAPVEFTSASLVIDGEVVYPWTASTDQPFHQFLGAFAWSHNSHRIALLDQVGDAIDVVTVSTEGKAKATHAPITLQGTDPQLAWSGDFVIVRTDQDALRINPESGKVDVLAPGASGSRSDHGSSDDTPCSN